MSSSPKNDLEDIPLHVIHLDQDDPKKCSARRLSKNGHVILHKRTRGAPRRGFLLDPSSGILMGPDDLRTISRGGAIVALDCSWKKLEESLDSISKYTKLEGRTLPVLLAANPISWGKPGRLSTAEAFASSLHILGRKEQARRILSCLPYGETFLELNRVPLDAYAEAETNEELANLQWEFFDKPL
ncbi:MAG: DUF367 family protein [Candidatus Thalassarchaeaceae archaeon]|nr:DUF367 family protein [Candidatus Thalassarchaeaceae archaeon]|tara:strand:+ start:1264 stop:1821 length:558 start_codon:yes stop_codon:yes gene_type:complete